MSLVIPVIIALPKHNRVVIRTDKTVRLYEATRYMPIQVSDGCTLNAIVSRIRRGKDRASWRLSYDLQPRAINPETDRYIILPGDWERKGVCSFMHKIGCNWDILSGEILDVEGNIFPVSNVVRLKPKIKV